MFTTIDHCRLCGHQDLVEVFNFGELAYTGVFPRSPDQPVARGPLVLMRCTHMDCGLLQLGHCFVPTEIYGPSYGYRSGLNPAVIGHLQQMVNTVMARGLLTKGDWVLDIGSNDGTLLGFYPQDKFALTGIDPLIGKFAGYYRKDIEKIDTFFNADALKADGRPRKAKVITAAAMFYDLNDPLAFMRDIHALLDDEGLVFIEQLYMPVMLTRQAYDAVCHEHVAYYGLKQMKFLARRCGFKIIDVVFSDLNGGSFLTVLAKEGATVSIDEAKLPILLDQEEAVGLSAPFIYEHFTQGILDQRRQLRQLLDELKRQGKKIIGYGASTKGNVVLQFCGIGLEDVSCIAEINADKFGAFAPGSNIPIIDERLAREQKPDYFLVMPWQFREFILRKETKFLQAGGALIFPLPHPEIITSTLLRSKLEVSN